MSDRTLDMNEIETLPDSHLTTLAFGQSPKPEILREQ